jgi:hypothetical protein
VHLKNVFTEWRSSHPSISLCPEGVPSCKTRCRRELDTVLRRNFKLSQIHFGQCHVLILLSWESINSIDCFLVSLSSYGMIKRSRTKASYDFSKYQQILKGNAWRERCWVVPMSWKLFLRKVDSDSPLPSWVKGQLTSSYQKMPTKQNDLLFLKV